MTFLDNWFNQKTWGMRLELHAKFGWILRPHEIAGLKVDGASHCVRGIDWGKLGR